MATTLLSMNIDRDFARITDQLREKGEYRIDLIHLETAEEGFTYGLASKALAYLDLAFMESTVHVLMAELLQNAEDALIKRLVLAEDEIDDPDGLQRLQTELSENRVSWRKELKKKKAGIRCEIKHDQDLGVTITVRSAAPTTVRERKLIEERLRFAQDRVEITGLDSAQFDTIQSGGRGLVMSLIALQQAGLPAQQLLFKPGGDHTLFSVLIPPGMSPDDRRKKIDSVLLSEVESLPSFPEHIKRMREICDDPDSDMKQVAEEIGRDESVTGQIIRLANSGGYAGGNVADLQDAVKIVGLKTISSLLIQIGSFGILAERYGNSADIMEHPVRVGFFSRQLARKHNRASLADQAYVAGLLHDIGKLVLLAKMPSGAAAQALSARRDRRTQVHVEEMAAGAGHAQIGALLAQKWNYPEILQHAIEFHHTPHLSSQEWHEIVYIVYMANCFSDYLDGKLSFFSVEPDALEFFNFTTEGAFKMVASALKQEFVEQSR